MRTKERTDVNANVLSLKQASMLRALAVARQAAADGLLRSRPRPAGVPCTRELRVK